jgi:hypothetical protein
LLDDYELTDITACSLEFHLRGDYKDWKPTLFDGIAKSILYSTYVDAKASSSLSAVIYSAFPVIISEWTHILSEFGFDTGHLGVLSSMLRALDDCEALQSRLEGNQRVDSDLIKSDLSSLISYAQHLQNDHPKEHSNTVSQVAPETFTAHNTVSAKAGGFGSGPPPPPTAYEPFAQHIQMKIDQIAYMTNLLLSLSFIASVYGMNLNIFNGGYVELSHYLATAIPFSFVVFVITFIVPVVLPRITGGRDRPQVTIESV